MCIPSTFTTWTYFCIKEVEEKYSRKKRGKRQNKEVERGERGLHLLDAGTIYIYAAFTHDSMEILLLQVTLHSGLLFHSTSHDFVQGMQLFPGQVSCRYSANRSRTARFRRYPTCNGRTPSRMPQLSKAAQMRAARAEGMSVGEIARLFGVTYHYAYYNVVTRAASAPFRTRLAIAEAKAESSSAAPNESLSNLALFRIASTKEGGKHAISRRQAARRILDERFPDESWINWMTEDDVPA